MIPAGNRRALTLVLVFVFVDVLGFSLILPLLPYYARTFGASATMVGLILSANAMAQLIGSPILGRLSDRFGRRPLLILSLAGTAASFLLLGLARSLAVIFASRVLDGLLGGSISLAQAYISDVTENKERAKGLGLIGAAFGLGFIFGPAAGGALSAGENYALPALVAAGLAVTNLLGVVLWLPESLPPERRREGRRLGTSAFSAAAMITALGRACVGPLLQAQLVFSLAFTIFESLFPLYAERRLGLAAQTTGYVLAYVGVLVVLVQGGAMGPLTRRFTDKRLIWWGSALAAVALLGWGLSPSLAVLLIVLAPLALASGVLRVAISSALTKSVYPEEVGGALGLSASLGSLARVVSPLSGAFLLSELSPAAPGMLAAVLMAWLVFYSRRHILPVPDFVCPPPREPASVAE